MDTFHYSDVVGDADTRSAIQGLGGGTGGLACGGQRRGKPYGVWPEMQVLQELKPFHSQVQKYFIPTF